MTGHAAAHPPQFFGSDVTSMQMPLHTICPCGHAHREFVHVCPCAHFVVQSPQYWGLDVTSTHVLLHAVAAFGGQPHVPLLHEPPAGHGFPHALQLEGSVSGLMHIALHINPLHVQVPALHVKSGLRVCCWHALSTAGSLSMVPSQSLSAKSHCSAA